MAKVQKSSLYDFFLESLDAVDPMCFFKEQLRFCDNTLFYRDNKYEIKGDIYLLSFGKASLRMTQGFLESTKGINLKKAFIVTHYNEKDVKYQFPSSCNVIYSSHPKFSEKSVEAGKIVYDQLASLKEGDLVVCLVSGGGSAMMALPRDEISINEKLDFLNLMLFSGVGEREINVLRKALSKIKGGRLADRFFPAKIINFIISDERAHKLTAIASGPTLCNDDDPLPIEVIEEYKLRNKVPPKILNIFENMRTQKVFGALPEIDNYLVATREKLVDCLESKNPYDDFLYFGNVGPHNVKEEKKRLIKTFREFAEKSPSSSGLMIACGELPVVPVPGSKGGRNQHFALEVLDNLQDQLEYNFLAVATDGCDYLEGVHGALVSNMTYRVSREQGIELKKYIGETKSYEFHDKVGSLIRGPYSGTNVSDFFLFSFFKN